MPQIWFPNLNIQIQQLNKVAFTIFNFPVYWYGIFIATAFILGVQVAKYNGEKSGFPKELYDDIIMYLIIFGIIGARIYYVAFRWDYFKNNLGEIFALRDGGIAIYGGIIGATVAVYFYCKKKKLDFLKLADTLMPSLILGQCIGRLGNFFNKEVFGGYTEGLFAMRIRTDVASYIPNSVADKILTINEVQYIQVQPTFLYEMVVNFIVFIVLMVMTNRKKYNGQIVLLYMLLYGLGRFYIEGIRTDQLLIGSVPVSQGLSAILVVTSLVILIYKKLKENVNE